MTIYHWTDKLFGYKTTSYQDSFHWILQNKILQLLFLTSNCKPQQTLKKKKKSTDILLWISKVLYGFTF